MIVMADHPTSSAASVQLSRQQILEATSRCLSDEGYDATTIRRIAARLDCAVGSIYRYFRDKRDLLDAVAQSALEPVAQVLDDGGTLEESASIYHDLANGDLAMYRLMYWIHAVGSDNARASTIPAVIARIIEGWTLLTGDQSAARRCWMMLHGCVTLGIDKQAMIRMLRSQVERVPASRGASSSPVTSRMTGRTAEQALTPVVMVKSPSDLLHSKPADPTHSLSSSAVSDMLDEEPAEDLLLL